MPPGFSNQCGDKQRILGSDRTSTGDDPSSCTKGRLSGNWSSTSRPPDSSERNIMRVGFSLAMTSPNHFWLDSNLKGG